jgi:hypothetical protein
MLLSKFKKNSIRLSLAVILLASTMGLTALTPAYALSKDDSLGFFSSSTAATSSACGALKELGSTADCSNGGVTIKGVLKTITNIISLIAGGIVVIMILLSGIKFMTSGGDPSKVSSAKNSLIYALIGLAVVALTQAIIHFTLHTATAANGGTLFYDQSVNSRLLNM